MYESKQNAPKRINRQQLAALGLVLVARNPLVVQCQICGAEWRPGRLLPGVRWWRCQNCCY
jgi:hypothetical protein